MTKIADFYNFDSTSFNEEMELYAKKLTIDLTSLDAAKEIYTSIKTRGKIRIEYEKGESSTRNENAGAIRPAMYGYMYSAMEVWEYKKADCDEFSNLYVSFINAAGLVKGENSKNNEIVALRAIELIEIKFFEKKEIVPAPKFQKIKSGS